MITVGVLTNRHEVPRLQRILAALARRSARVELLVEEERPFGSDTPPPPWDVCFTKGRGPAIQAQALAMEAAGIPTHNCAFAIQVTNHRFLASVLAEGAGVPQPEFAYGRARDLPFARYIEKNASVELGERFVPRIRDRADAPPADDHEAYFQREVKAGWEHKVFSVGSSYRCFKQLPVMINPDKMASRVPIPDVPELIERARRVKAACRLSVTSMDFLDEDGGYLLTDVNSAPNLERLPDGPEWLADWLIAQARGR